MTDLAFAGQRAQEFKECQLYYIMLRNVRPPLVVPSSKPFVWETLYVNKINGIL